MPPEGHRGRVAHRDPGHMLDRDCLLVVGEQVGGHPAGAAQRHIDRGPHRRGGLVQQRQHQPEPGPGQPQAEQHRRHAGRPAGRLRSRTAPTSPALGSTAGAPAAGPPARPPSDPPPRAAWSALTPHTPSRRCAHAPYRRGGLINLRAARRDASYPTGSPRQIHHRNPFRARAAEATGPQRPTCRMRNRRRHRS